MVFIKKLADNLFSKSDLQPTYVVIIEARFNILY
jgi:hypothetical protein